MEQTKKELWLDYAKKLISEIEEAEESKKEERRMLISMMDEIIGDYYDDEKLNHKLFYSTIKNTELYDDIKKATFNRENTVEFSIWEKLTFELKWGLCDVYNSPLTYIDEFMYPLIKAEDYLAGEDVYLDDDIKEFVEVIKNLESDEILPKKFNPKPYFMLPELTEEQKTKIYEETFDNIQSY